MQTEEWTRFGHNAQLDLGYLHAHYVRHAYPRHSHDYYVICLIERGRQSFLHEGTKYATPSGGVILINPGAVHTGEAVDEQGFEMLSLYPTVSQMEMLASDLTGSHRGLPFFKDVRVDDSRTTQDLLSLHRALFDSPGSLESESRFLWIMTQLVKRYADASFTERKLGREKKAIEHACQYIDENFASGVSLSELARQVAFSPYYFLRVFRAEVGMPPYEYLENVRVRRAQQLIESGKSLADVTVEAGFSSQSHLTRHFKKIIGVTPGQYAHEITL
jgi:AraC-like DNA-binding protein